MTDILGKIIDEIIESVFPRRCPVCGEIVKEKGHLICKKCIKMKIENVFLERRF